MHTKEKFHLTARWMCFAVLLFAAVLRLAMEPAVQEGLRSSAARLISQERLHQAMLLFGAGVSGEESAKTPEQTSGAASPAKTYPDMLYTPSRRWTEQTSFTAEDAALVDINNRAEAEFDAAELITRPLPFDASVEGPLVLIVHTHATEAYTPTAENDYDGDGSYHTRDVHYNVVRVGQALADTLNECGIETINDETLNDDPSYNESYLRSAEVIERYLQEYPSIQMVIDLHRDAVEDSGGNQLAMTKELEGESYARLLLVMGTDVSGMYHPNWEDNLSCALKVQALCEKRYEGLFRQMSLRSQRYNEHLTPCSMLLEVGTAGNTLEQAMRTARLFGRTLAELLTAP